MKKVWKEYAGQVAWPTLGLVAVLATLSVAVPAAVIGGVLPLWLGFVVMLVVDYAWFTPLHEATHGNVGGSKRWARLDDAVGWLSSLCYVAPYPAFKAIHLRHHGTVNREDKDPDMWVAAPTPAGVAARCLTIVPHYYWMFLGKMRNESPAMRRAAVQCAVSFVAFGAVLVALTASGWGWYALWLWVVPGWLASGLLAFAFDYVPHVPHDDRGRYTNARVLLGGPVLTWMMAAQNYHLVHHLWPRVPFYAYGEVFRRTRPLLEANGAPVTEL